MTETHFVSFSQTRVLVADDDPILREFAAVHLATPTVEVEVVEDGILALDRLHKGGIDIALVDLDMPRMNGFELIEHIRWDERLKHLPVVVATGREDMVAIDHAFALGANSFVVKPLNWRLLSHQLAYVLRNSRAQDEVREQLDDLRKVSDLRAGVLRLTRKKISGPMQDMLDIAQTMEAHSHDPATASLVLRIADASVALSHIYTDIGEAERVVCQP